MFESEENQAQEAGEVLGHYPADLRTHHERWVRRKTVRGRGGAGRAGEREPSPRSPGPADTYGSSWAARVRC